MAFPPLRPSNKSDSAIATPSFSPPVRPKFHHRYTDDRLRESCSSSSGTSPLMISNIRKDRRSMFKELGLDTDTEGETTYPNQLSDKEFAEITGLSSAGSDRTGDYNSSSERGNGSSEGRRVLVKQSPRDNNRDSNSDSDQSPQSATSNNSRGWLSKLVIGRRPKIKTATSAPPPTMGSLTRLTSVALLVAIVIPGFSYYNGQERVELSGADAGVMRYSNGPILDKREDSPEICKRWSHQAASLNGTLYIYGGQAKTSGDQTTNTWNNNLYTLDLTKSWDLSSPSVSYHGQPDGPPPVANGYLWNDYNNLYLYGGEFADNPYVNPAPVSTWKYDIRNKKWIEYPNPVTTAGNNSAPAGIPVQRAGEGAGLSVPELGVSWYFGGHLDLATTPGWSNQIARVYLKSMLEFTHPGYTNDGVWADGAGEEGMYRNITEGKIQATDAFAERADGVLVYVPGWGTKGVLIGMAGGDSETFVSDLSTLDVYDIASSTWYNQETSGTPPGVRVNPCAVVAVAPDASSFNIYLYGGQNLLPAKQQTQYDDMYILSIPSFTWVKVPQSGSNKPSGRAGHTCTLRDGQMVLIGGYTGQGTDCDKPGVYIFNTSSLEWTDSFHALDHPADILPENSVLANSFGYSVPDVVASVIGGDSKGGATLTQPGAGPATAGPFATGTAPVFTVTATASGTAATVTSSSAPGVPTGNSPTTVPADPSPDRKAGLIAAAVIASLAGLLALYLGYCAWLYRRQVRAYKTHLAAVNRYSVAASQSRGSFRGLAAFFGRSGSNNKKSAAGNRLSNPFADPPAMAEQKKSHSSSLPRRGRTQHRRDESASTANSDDAFAWVGGSNEPKLLFGDPTPDSQYSPSRASRTNTRPPVRYGGYDSGAGGSGTTAAGSSMRPTPQSEPTPGDRGRESMESGDSTEGLLDGQEPSFFSVVLGPRRALRVVNGLEEGEGLERGDSLRR